MSVALALTLTFDWTDTLAFGVAGAVVLGVVGLVDDLRSISARRRLLMQAIVSLVTASAVIFPAEVGGPVLAVASAVVAAAWLTGFVNVYNFMDGANGVAGLSSLIAGVWYMSLAATEGSPALAAGGAALAGASAGFLPWNFPRARVFMGDVGSYSIGFLLGWLALVAFKDTGSLVLAVAPVCVLLADTTVTLTRRVAQGQPLMTAHRDHAYQRLTPTAGGRPTAALLVSMTTVACLLAVALPTYACLLAWALILVAYMCAPRALAPERVR
jgi:UDP-N-acetylmuramyl pentapeptide phosphotransferase/UDP-N-acetylglucosamine-1-phosphate transferase